MSKESVAALRERLNQDIDYVLDWLYGEPHDQMELGDDLATIVVNEAEPLHIRVKAAECLQAIAPQAAQGLRVLSPVANKAFEALQQVVEKPVTPMALLSAARSAMAGYSVGPAGNMIKYVGRDRKERTLIELKDDAVSKFHLLGKAEGADPNHCLYLCAKNTEHFEHRIFGYRKVAPTHPEMACAVEFYSTKDFKAFCTKETPWDKATLPVLHVEGDFVDDLEIYECKVCGTNWSDGPDV